MIKLHHRTSFDSAESIFKERAIHGAPYGENSHESLPHFCIESKISTRTLPLDKDIEIIFGSNMEEVEINHLDLLSNDSTKNHINKVISIYNDKIEGGYWQSVIRPESENPLFLVRFIILRGLPKSSLLKKMNKIIDRKDIIKVRWNR